MNRLTEQKTRAALYIRVSTEEQKREGFSIAAQENILRDYCERHGFEFFDVYNDAGYSGKDFNRPRMQQLLRDLQDNKFDVVLAVAVDRISRNNLDVLTFVDRELKPRNKKLLITTCDIDSSTDSGRMFISLLGTFAEYERQLIVSRVKKGMEQRASEGKFNGGKILGYDVVDKKLVINAEEARTVKQIFEHRAAGKGYKWIATRLNTLGKKTKNNRAFSINTIKTIVCNEKYIGIMVWGKQRDWNVLRRHGKSQPTRAPGVHDSIIDPDLWGKVQKVQKANNQMTVSQSNYKGEFILSGLLRCPSCGAGTVMSKSKKRDGSGYHLYYMCQNYHSKGKTVCRANLIKKEFVEAQLLTYMRTILNRSEIVDGVINKLNNTEHDQIVQLTQDLNAQRAIYNKLIEKQKKQDRDYHAEVDGLSPSVYSRLSESVSLEINEVTGVIASIEREIEKQKSPVCLNKDMVIEALSSFNELYSEASIEEKRALMRSLIKEIHMDSDRKAIRNIVFWFTEHDVSNTNPALPATEMGRTVS